MNVAPNNTKKMAPSSWPSKTSLWKAGVFQMDSIAKGRVISVENRNIHFIIVTDEYLSVSGLDTTK